MFLRQKLQQQYARAAESKLLQDRLRYRADQNAEIDRRLHSCLHKNRWLLPNWLALPRRKAHESRKTDVWRVADLPIRKYVFERWGIFGSWGRQLSELHVLNAADASLYSNMLELKVSSNNEP